jgi:hypothetical protein
VPIWQWGVWELCCRTCMGSLGGDSHAWCSSAG